MTQKIKSQSSQSSTTTEQQHPCWPALGQAVKCNYDAFSRCLFSGEWPTSTDFSAQIGALAVEAVLSLKLPYSFFAANYPTSYEVVCESIGIAPHGTEVETLRKVVRHKLSARINEKLAAFSFSHRK